MKINNYLKTKKRSNVSVNLTSLMDIFTVIVFFLLFNIHDESFIKDNIDIKLPISEIAKSSFSERKDVLSLEVENENKFVLNGEEFKNVKNLELKVKETCEDKLQCSFFLIYAKNDEKYSLIDSFVKMASRVNIKNTYFIVKQV
ncbi:TPA: biopolymer transporter ExbD [Photobacterium damselae]